jgi:LPS-assembly protein
MKNNFKFFLSLFFLCMVFLSKEAICEELKFETNVIETFDNDTLVSSGGVKITNKLGQIITGNELQLNNDSKIHVLKGNVFFIDNFKNEILSEELIINENDHEYIFNRNVVVKDKINLLTLNSSKLILNQKENILISNKKAVILDNLNNTIETKKFKFFLNEKKLIAHDVKIFDEEKNIYEIERIDYDLVEKKVYGKDIAINQNNNNLSSTKHVPRSKSRSLVIEENFTTLKKSVYTNCKKREGCPIWLISAENIIHDKKNKVINYKNATLKFYDIPIFYFPKFFHPDPTVKRQSGFLTPSFSAQNTGGYLTLPYFFAISENSDFTLTPRIYDNSKNLYQGEYRKVNKNENHIFDVSIKNDNPLLLDDKSTDSHFFSKSKINSNLSFFENSYFDINLQSVSDEKYLKSFDVNSPIINSQTLLSSSIEFNGYKDDLDFLFTAEVYEDLTKKNSSDRYEYILPNFSITKTLSSELEGLFEINTLAYNKLYETNINERVIVNNFKYRSLDILNKFGFVNNYELNVKNFNADSENSKSLKNKTENTLQSIIQFNSKLPMLKKGEKFDKTITPIFSAKINPYKNKNINNDDRLIDYDNIFSVNRLSSNEVLEGGMSITLGNEYKIFNKSNLNDEIFGFNLATSFRDKENYDLPTKSSLGQKTSNFVGQTNIKLNDFVDLNYDFISDNNLTDLKYHKVSSDFRINNFVTSFEFLEENNSIGMESFISNESSYQFNENKSLLFRTRKNKKTDLTEYYDLIYQYKMDCLTAGIKYKKSYYSDGELTPKESVFFSVTFMPFDNTVNLPGIDK